MSDFDLVVDKRIHSYIVVIILYFFSINSISNCTFSPIRFYFLILFTYIIFVELYILCIPHLLIILCLKISIKLASTKIRLQKYIDSYNFNFEQRSEIYEFRIDVPID